MIQRRQGTLFRRLDHSLRVNLSRLHIGYCLRLHQVKTFYSVKLRWRHDNIFGLFHGAFVRHEVEFSVVEVVFEAGLVFN